jgi:hypothetical protein
MRLPWGIIAKRIHIIKKMITFVPKLMPKGIVFKFRNTPKDSGFLGCFFRYFKISGDF